MEKTSADFRRVAIGHRIACRRPRVLQVADEQIRAAESELQLER